MDLTLPPEPKPGCLGCPEYAALPCEPGPILDYLARRSALLKYPPTPRSSEMCIEWFHDKNNRLAHTPTGHIRMINVGRGAYGVWVEYPPEMLMKYFGFVPKREA